MASTFLSPMYPDVEVSQTLLLSHDIGVLPALTMYPVEHPSDWLMFFSCLDRTVGLGMTPPQWDCSVSQL